MLLLRCQARRKGQYESHAVDGADIGTKRNRVEESRTERFFAEFEEGLRALLVIGELAPPGRAAFVDDLAFLAVVEAHRERQQPAVVLQPLANALRGELLFATALARQVDLRARRDVGADFF